MNYENAPRARPPDLLPRHLDLLGQALSRLAGETRLTLARTVASVAANLIGEAVSNALAVPVLRQRHEPWGHREWPRSAAGKYDDLDEAYDDHPDDYWEDDDYVPEPHPRSTPARPVSISGPAALALGLRVSAWWLHRHTDKAPVLSTLALGAVTATVAVAGGPMALAGLGVVEAVLGLHELTRFAVAES